MAYPAARAWTSWARPPVRRPRQIAGLEIPGRDPTPTGSLTKYAQPSRTLSTSSLAPHGCGVSQRSSAPVREDSRASRSPPRPALAGVSDATKADGTGPPATAPARAIAATRWAEAGPAEAGPAATGWAEPGAAGVPLAHPAAAAMTRAATAP